jgi:hypothetical protein
MYSDNTAMASDIIDGLFTVVKVMYNVYGDVQ